MPVGVEDGTHYETKTDFLLGRPLDFESLTQKGSITDAPPPPKPLTFEERAEPVTKAIETGDFDPVGGNYTPFRSPPPPYREPTGEVQTAFAIQDNPVYPWAGQPSTKPDYEDLKRTEGEFEKNQQLHNPKREDIPRGPLKGQEEVASVAPIRLGLPKNVAGEGPHGHVMSDAEFIPEAGKQYAMADMAPEGMRIPVAKVQKNTQEQYGGGGGVGGVAGVAETIKGAAIKSEGKIYEGPSHFNILQKNPNLHVDKAEDGFVTSTGRFVSREEAMKIHHEGKIPVRERDWLDSGDLRPQPTETEVKALQEKNKAILENLKNKRPFSTR